MTNIKTVDKARPIATNTRYRIASEGYGANVGDILGLMMHNSISVEMHIGA